MYQPRYLGMYLRPELFGNFRAIVLYGYSHFFNF
jgi:hypothetical protein